MGRRHHSSTHSVRTRAVLVRTNLGVASSYPSAAATTPTHLHPVFCHLRSGHRGDVGHVCNIHSLLLEHSSTSGQLSSAIDTSTGGPDSSSAEGGLR